MTKDEWVREALTDDGLVAELLVRLKQSEFNAALPVLLPLQWGLRQPRSRPVLRCNAVPARKEREPTRCSPTTPLSWSGGASPSDGYEESSRPVDRFTAARSKGNAANEITTTGRRSRRKKTFAELKEEESLLLKERKYLKKELATLRVTFEEESARNETWKRMKIVLDLQSAKKISATSDAPEKAISSKPNQMEASTLDHSLTVLPTHASCNDLPPSDSCKVQNDVATRESFIMLPDLNMMPSQEDSGSETLYGMS